VAGFTPVGKLAKGVKAGVAVGKATLWTGGAVERGRTIERALGATVGKRQGWGVSLDRLCGPRCNNFPVADYFNRETGLLTSVKSINTANTGYFKKKVGASAKALANAGELKKGRATVRAGSVKARQLVVAVPAGQQWSPAARRARWQAKKSASDQGVAVKYVFVK